MLRSKPDIPFRKGLRLLEALSNYLRAVDCDPKRPLACLACCRAARSFRRPSALN
jgi:hypothetical protein